MLTRRFHRPGFAVPAVIDWPLGPLHVTARARQRRKSKLPTEPSSAPGGIAPAQAGRRVSPAAAGRPSAVLKLRGTIGRHDEIKWWQIADWIDQNADASHLEIVIVASDGGEVMDGELIFNTIRRATPFVTTRVELRCDSAAIDIFLAGDRRVAKPGAGFLLHFSASAGDPRLTAARHRHQAEKLAAMDERLIARLVERTGTPAEEWRAIIDAERLLSAYDAQVLGLVHEAAP